MSWKGNEMAVKDSDGFGNTLGLKMIIRDDIPLGSTYENGREVTFKVADGSWLERTYDSNGNPLTFKDSDGYWTERTYDDHGNELTFKDADGFWAEATYDDQGNELTYQNSNGARNYF